MRIDHCENLIHFTKGESNVRDYEEAYQRLKSIVRSRQLNGGNGMILGGHRCICFTESPVKCLTNKGSLDSKYFSRYTPFGLQYSKEIVFHNGGRPVIYSLREEYENLKENNEINWRFVSYDPTQKGRLDFSWEREWRIRKDHIPVYPEQAKLVFPNRDWIDRFIHEHEQEHHGHISDPECEECYCTREATIINFTDFLNDESCETLISTCPDPERFPWVLINMNECEN